MARILIEDLDIGQVFSFKESQPTARWKVLGDDSGLQRVDIAQLSPHDGREFGETYAYYGAEVIVHG